MDGDDDYQADIAIGRFSTNNERELENMVNKTIAYESKKNNFAQNVLLVAHKEYAPQKYQNCSEEIRNASYTESMSFEKHMELQQVKVVQMQQMQMLFKQLIMV